MKIFPAAAVFLIVPCLFVSGAALAEKADREKPVQIEAARVSIDERNKTQTFEGNVVLRQGTFELKGDRLVVHQQADGFQMGEASGNPATFRQKRDDSPEYIEGQAKRIQYDARDERARLYGDAKIHSGGDAIQAQYIEYDAMREKYFAANAPEEKSAGAQGRRVQVVLQPREKGKDDGAKK